MVDSIGSAPWNRLQVWFAGGEGCRENDSMDVLEQKSAIFLLRQAVDLRGIGERRDRARKCS